MKTRRVRRYRSVLLAALVGSIIGVTTQAFAASVDSGWQDSSPIGAGCYFPRAQTVTYPFSAVDFNGGLASRQNVNGCYMWNPVGFMAGMREDASLYGYDGMACLCEFSENRSGDTVFIGQRYNLTGNCSAINTWGTQSSAFYGAGGDNFFNAWSGSTGW